MIKIFFSAFLLLTITTNAQVRNYTGNKSTGVKTTKSVKKKLTYSDSDSKFGIVAGLLIANETSDELESSAPRLGFYAGVSYNSNLSETLGLEVNLVYATMGAVYSDGYDDYKDQLNYLQLPVTLNVKAIKNLNVQVGPQFGYLMSATFDGNDYKEYLKTIDYGLVLGLGVEFPNTNFGIGSKYYFGLANINKDSSYGSVKNSSFSIGASYNF
jgi:hypothetical protein